MKISLTIIFRVLQFSCLIKFSQLQKFKAFKIDDELTDESAEYLFFRLTINLISTYSGVDKFSDLSNKFEDEVNFQKGEAGNKNIVPRIRFYKINHDWNGERDGYDKALRLIPILLRGSIENAQMEDLLRIIIYGRRAIKYRQGQEKPGQVDQGHLQSLRNLRNSVNIINRDVSTRLKLECHEHYSNRPRRDIFSTKFHDTRIKRNQDSEGFDCKDSMMNFDIMPENEYVEDETLYLANIENGPRDIGDLWNCRTSKSEGLNLFNENITDFMAATPTHVWRYDMSHVKDLKTSLENIDINGEFKLDIMAGFIKLEGKGQYLSKQGYDFLEEKLIISYNSETFIVRALNSARNVIDQNVKEKILRGLVNATHVVTKVTLAGEVTASVKIKSYNEQNKTDVAVNFLVKLPLGRVSAALKADLSILDSKLGETLDRQITINSRPPMFKSPPGNVTQMFETIESITKEISQSKYFPKLNKDGMIIIGVPLKYTLVPISNILEQIEIEKLNEKMNEETLSNFIDMFDLLERLQSNGFIKKQLLDQNPHIIKIISDPQNDFSKYILANETELGIRARKFSRRGKKILLEYKHGSISIKGIDDFYTKIFQKKFNLTLIQENVDHLLNYGNKLCGQARLNDIGPNSFINILSSRSKLDGWLSRKGGMKILFLTNGAASNGAAAFQLYNLGPALNDKGIDVAVAVPNICQNFSIIINVRDKTINFEKENITTIVKTLEILLGNGFMIDRNFVQISSSLNGIPFLDNFSIPNFMTIYDIIKFYSNIEFVDNYSDLENIILDKNEKSFIFILAMDAYCSVYDAIKLFRNLKNQFPNGRWIAANFELPENVDAPLMIVFKNGTFLASIFDNLDLAFVIEHIKMNKLDDLKSNYTFSSKNLGKNFIHPAKIDFIFRLLNNYGVYHLEPIHEANGENFNKIDNLLKVLVAATSNMKFAFLGKVLDLVKIKHQSIYASASENLTIYDKDGYPNISNENIQDWRKFTENLELKKSESFLVDMLAQTSDYYLRSNKKDFKGEIIQNYLERIPENEIQFKSLIQNRILQKDYWKAIQILSPQRFNTNSQKILIEINKVTNFTEKNVRRGFYQDIFQLSMTSDEINGLCNDPIISYYSKKDGNIIMKEKCQINQRFFSFGAANGDSEQAKGRSISDKLNFHCKFNGKLYTTLIIDGNLGVIRFDPIILNVILIFNAPMDTSYGGSVYYRMSSKNEDLALAEFLIQRADGNIPIKLTKTLIITYDKVPFYKTNDTLAKCPDTQERNSFQGILATDENHKSYMIFIYKELNWVERRGDDLCTGLTDRIHTGIIYQDLDRFTRVYNLEKSAVVKHYTKAALLSNSNVGIPGIYVLRVDELPILPKIQIVYSKNK